MMGPMPLSKKLEQNWQNENRHARLWVRRPILMVHLRSKHSDCFQVHTSKLLAQEVDLGVQKHHMCLNFIQLEGKLLLFLLPISQHPTQDQLHVPIEFNGSEVLGLPGPNPPSIRDLRADFCSNFILRHKTSKNSNVGLHQVDISLDVWRGVLSVILYSMLSCGN